MILPSLVDKISECKPLEDYKGVFYFDVIKKGWNWKYIKHQILYIWAKLNNKIMY